MSRSGSLPIEAFGAGSGRASRCDERVGPRRGAERGDRRFAGTRAGSSMAGSEDRVRDDAAPAGTAGPLMTGPVPEPEPQLVQGADTVTLR